MRAVRQVLEEKLVKRGVSMKALEYGKAEEAAGGTVRQTAKLNAGHLLRQGARAQQVHQGRSG